MTPQAPSDTATSRSVMPILVVCAILFAMSSAAIAAVGGGAILAITILVGITFAFVHGVEIYGLKTMLIFFGIVFVISVFYETLSIKTGFPFGHYNYSQENYPGPWLGVVPLLIMPAYFAAGYSAWIISLAIHGKTDGTIAGAERFTVPLLAMFAMVSWDMSIDPNKATISQLWIWHDGGVYFGVPFVNFIGWYLCVFTFFWVFTRFLSRADQQHMHASAGPATSNLWFWALPVIVYLSRMLEFVVDWLTRESVQVTSNDGHVWWTGDIYGSLVLVCISTMVMISAVAFVIISRQRQGRA
jgi:uncharacterized membrane protein